MSAEWVKRLQSSDSRLHKEDVLKQALELEIMGSYDAGVFLGLLKACYDPFITFNIRQVPTTAGLVNRENPWGDFNTLLGNLYARNVTGNAARDAVQEMSLRFDSDEWNLFCGPVIQKDLKAGISDKTINKILGKTRYRVPVFECQLATSCEDRPEMSGRKRLEPKLDGVRVLMMVTHSGVISYSRNGKMFENFSHIEDQILRHFAPAHGSRWGSGLILDGKVTSESFRQLMTQARRKTNVENTDSVFHVFDCIPVDEFNKGMWNRALNQRISDLSVMLGHSLDRIPNVRLLDHIVVDLDTAEGHDQLDRYARDCVEAGYEGIMIKDLAAPYECGRNTNWLKWKPVHDYDLTIVGVEEGTGKNRGRLGALICEGVDAGKHIRVNVGSGFSDEERDEFWADQSIVIGQTVVVLADAVTQNRDGSYSLRFPRFKTFRTDQ